MLKKFKVAVLLTCLFFSPVGQAAAKQTSAEKKAEKETIAKQKAEEATIPMQDNFLERQVSIHSEILTHTRDMLLKAELKKIDRESYMEGLKLLGWSAVQERNYKTATDSYISQCKQSEIQRKQAESNLANLKLDATKFFNGGKWPERLTKTWDKNTINLLDQLKGAGANAYETGSLTILTSCY